MSLPRYAEYKDSGVPWLGEVPKHWDVAPFKRLVEFQNGSDHKPIEVEDGYPVYGSGGVFAYASEYMHDGESVLLGRKGTVDRPLYVTGKFWTVDTMYWTHIATDACGKFCYYAALSIPFSYYSTNTALPSMTQGALGAHLMAFPDKEEQVEVAAFLDRETAKIDALIAEQETLLALLAEKRQATISHAVTRGLDPDVPMKDSGIAWLGEVPAHWEVMQLRNIARIVRGASPRPAGDPRFFADDGDGEGNVPWLTVAEITKDESLYVEDVREYLTALGAEHSQRFEKGIVVFSNSGATLGVPKILGIECCANDGVLAFRDLSPHVDPEHLYCFLLTTTQRLRTEMKQGGGQPNLNTDIVKAIGFACPPLGEQSEIVAFLHEKFRRFEELKDAAEQNVTLLSERRSALIAAAVTGKIDVRGLQTC